ncbi:hypothetical protein IHE44_0005797 [Lamprotornis superbus]|uniref:Transcription initiation factor TFIID subunit 13 n=1 Tax=Lamprotornis superbus TaxID=245042 RepID=A0A835NV36_9PASS|nr:hypothetical protein IHE44_0005797 [Lamprotornis superbus]
MGCMMYGFGDDQNPYTESVDILEDLVIEFITEMTHKAMSIGRQGRVQVEDIVFLIRKDPRKFARVKDLLTMNEELKRARKAFDEANYGIAFLSASDSSPNDAAVWTICTRDPVRCDFAIRDESGDDFALKGIQRYGIVPSSGFSMSIGDQGWKMEIALGAQGQETHWAQP